MLRSLRFFWRINLAVVAAAAVTCAVVTGALLVGDSVRGSLRGMTESRLGQIDDALVSARFFRESLTADLAEDSDFRSAYQSATPFLVVDGSAVHAQTRRRSSEVSLYGVPAGFGDLFGTRLTLERQSGQFFTPVVINSALQRALEASVGDQMILSLARPSDIHRESLMGRREEADLIQTVRAVVSSVLPDDGIGRFSLQANQALPLVAYIDIGALQRSLERPGQVNAMALARQPGQPSSAANQIFENALRDHVRLEDMGLKLVLGDQTVSLETSDFVLSPWLVEVAENAAGELGLETQRTFTYLANSIQVGDRKIPYSTISALGLTTSGDLLPLLDSNGDPLATPEAGQIYLNEWAMQDLAPEQGAPVEVRYFRVGPQDDLVTESHVFRFAGMAQLAALGADPTLTPEFPGIHEADNMSEWDPPFPVDLDSIRPRDEEYWDEHRATPKAFVSPGDGTRLWASRFGSVTSLRIGLTPETIPETLVSLEQKLRESIEPAQGGLRWQPVREQGLDTASGPTDFAGLFIGFSLFIIVSAALIVALLFRLGVEQRSREVGLLSALGFRAQSVLRRFLAEGLLLVMVGSAVGLVGAVLYADFMIYALTTWWRRAVGTQFLSLHVLPSSLAMGYLITLLVVVVAIWLSLRKMVRLPLTALLAGKSVDWGVRRLPRRPRLVAHLFGILAVGLFAAGFFLRAQSALLFFGTGATLLISGLAYFTAWCRATDRQTSVLGGRALWRLATRNSARNPGRSAVSTILIASAVFVIVAVGANRYQPLADVADPTSGTGGFALVAQTTVPILQDLGTSKGRFDLGFSEADSQAVAASTVYPFRYLPGDDTSCLNLYRPEKPQVLGVPDSLIRRGGFSFQATLEDSENPWELLKRIAIDDPDVIPAFGDFESVQWILHKGLGDEIPLTNEQGREVRLKFVGLLHNSIFQSEVLVAEDQLLKHFPSRTGHSFFLLEAPGEAADEVATALEKQLGTFGFDTVPAPVRLAGFLAVRGTYISTFQVLGGLGLLLGTLGLGIVLVRNVLERRAELATMRALGFSQNSLVQIVLAENAFLLFAGLGLGTIAALVSVAPNLLAGAQVPWATLLGTLGLVLLVGMLSSLAGVRAALSTPLLPALKEE